MEQVKINNNSLKYISEEDVKTVLSQYNLSNGEVMESYDVYNADEKMLGFICDYWKLKVNLVTKTGERKVLSFFVKAVSRTNAAKAEMVKEYNLFKIENSFYSVIKSAIELPDLKQWSPKMVVTLNDDAMVFEDLNVMKYKLRDKFARFDDNHLQEALRTLASFHASSIIFEEDQSKIVQRPYRIKDELAKGLLLDTGYTPESIWFNQCKNGALHVVKLFSKYKENKTSIEKCWSKIWDASLSLQDTYSQYRSVLSHRDLWNNNLLFHYKIQDGKIKADDCLMVDFQAVLCQPPAADVMLLLYCNLDRRVRDEKLKDFLEFYYQELKGCLEKYSVNIDDVISRKQFWESVEVYRQWALVVCACLIPMFWIHDDLTTTICSNTEQFDDILSKNKGAFIEKLMSESDDYKQRVMEVFDEIVERYCLES